MERSTTGDERQTRRGEEKSTGATLAIRLADRLSVICRAIIGRSFAEAALFSAWLYEIASLPRGVITKNQAKRPKSHHRASTLFLQFWRGAIDTHAGPLFARLSSRRSSSLPPSLSLFLSLARTLSRFLHGDPERKIRGKERNSRWLDSFVHSVNLLTGEILSYTEFINWHGGVSVSIIDYVLMG